MEDPVRPRFASQYLQKFIQEVQRKLEKAVEVPSQRGDLLRQFFTDIALEVDVRAQARLYNQEENLDNLAITGSGNKLCFYQVVAGHYAQVPDDGKEVLPLFVKLWSQSFTSQIFALLFHQWLFEFPRDESDGNIRLVTAFVDGASNIFWLDLQSNVRRFSSLYKYVLQEVILNPGRLSKVPIQARRNLVLLLSRFFFFYERADRLKNFLGQFPVVPPSFLPPADIFVIELTDQLQKVKVEPVLLHYLQSTRALNGVELRVKTSTRLKSALYSFTSPGGPMYPTRPVRHAAWDTLDSLFPVGRMSRHLISLFFRLLHPYYWPMSFWNFVVTSFTATLAKVYMILLILWQSFFGRRHLQPA